MPIINSTYNPPFLFKSGHISTIYSGLLRKVENLDQIRIRINLPDTDYLDLDWSYSKTSSKKLVLIIHGLEGSSKRAYIKGSAKALTESGFDVCAINLRGCSGTMNNLYRSYHSGATEDLHAVISYVLQLDQYPSIFLHGFSLGGNLLLKYLGEQRELPKEIIGAVAISVPCQLADSLHHLLQFKNILYAKRFKGNLIKKLKLKQQLFPDHISDTDIEAIKTLKDFDDFYTSKAHGFTDAMDYYKKSSSLQFLEAINIPTLIINAKNDSFLGKECYPIAIADQHKYLFLEIPKYGGHVGFYGPNNYTYSEKRTIEFLTAIK
ncbi:YheT family hydrolase [Maribacter hydrothermalis]|uniref:Alpha/beta hydrolase n=1 Tax=Maribacter hydrothermalis TaxID=1836467 RepID=A0A1B7Z3Y3_9FLAO|nr:alpha/beta fold hydrolase [Maribacter hydrothermalis]APQ17137.1 alpha/beta hydrolase [Maribacter hydrothermalis]OBR37398.1 alpha/beta hydrolase [Maribacter hydrothermalis]